jgi:hypothetical protein
MQNDWILDVLRDLKGFADLNGLELLSQQLERTQQVALAEIAALLQCEATTAGQPRKM